jgi:hypothetical protein
VVVAGGTNQLNRALPALEQRAITLEVALRQPRLDEVFLALTGQAQQQQPAPADDRIGPAGAPGG